MYFAWEYAGVICKQFFGHLLHLGLRAQKKCTGISKI